MPDLNASRKMDGFQNTAIAFSHKSDAELAQAYRIFSILNFTLIARILTALGRFAFWLRLPITPLIKKSFFSYFCGGETLGECQRVIQNLANHRVKTVLDYSVEGGQKENDFDNTQRSLLQLLDFAKGDDRLPFCVFKMTGLVNAELMEKKQAQVPLSAEEQAQFERAKTRLEAICKRAYEYQLPVLIDAEHSRFQDVVDELAYTMMARYNTEKALIFNTFQMYRTDMLDRLQQAYEHAVKGNYKLGVKLVRGAYMEEERREAKRHNAPSPIWTTKEETDQAFNQGLVFCINHIDHIQLACGSHNDASNQYLTDLMAQHGMAPNDHRVWFIQLYGMNDHVSFNLANQGYCVAKYLPYGPASSVIPYLIRRAEENSSVVGQSGRELALIRAERARRKHRDQASSAS